MPETDAPPKRRERRKAERPGEILDAAFEEFVKHGYAATRLEDVAARAGVTKGTIYFYFDTKERVFDEMIRHVSRPVFAELNSFVGALHGSYRTRLRALIGFLHTRMAGERASRETLRFLIAEGARFPDLVERHYLAFMQPFTERLREIIAAGIQAGEFRPTPAANFPEIIVSPAILLNVWWMLFGDRRPIDVEAYIDASFDLLMRGLSGAAATGASAS
ncbi:TetR/AcrR family transcriptional regulator [Bradyrhizobium prioriisuperbiae]|uniref:TetR/AcrR family transcriptional regulator n=1 Tax=Bradyrhizobium prioriisuperbiae TaxID=2854389 RepID=UPI0028E5D108|nr:TetR/AcrR family transcriptional regulator [Bradyrhizobium prioritasuperba]